MKAVVDIGTNTVRMLIGDVGEEGKVKVHAQFIAEPRLGVGITKGQLTPEAVDRTIKALAEFKRITQDYKVEDVIAAATSAVRDAINQTEFVDEVFHKIGWQVQVISGEKEAELSYTGAVSVLLPLGLPVVIDIGGGSTEVIFARDGEIKGISVNVGAVRLHEAAWSQEELDRKLLPLTREFTNLGEKISLVAVGGTATTAAAIHYGITEYSRAAVQGRFLTLESIKKLKDQLKGMPLKERKKIVGLTPKRADIIVPGLEILVRMIELSGEPGITVSDAGILDGLLLSRRS
ncbi:MAG: Ppx/GppA family phosphatase [Dehalobacterium sp.]